jgi:DNA polymerase III gamma/tau subunit
MPWTRASLHHAYLFTGTRGVGKTTIARISRAA